MVVIGVDIAEKDSVEVGSSDNMFRSDAGCLLVRKQLVPFLKNVFPWKLEESCLSQRDAMC